jgi:hypothetical protein
MSRTVKTWIGAFALLAVTLGAPSAQAEPNIPGFSVTTYAAAIEHPQFMTFDPNGILYVGRRTGDACCDPARIHKVAAGGGGAVDYGPLIPDPDGVLADPSGWFGPAGGVLVGSGQGGAGAVRTIRPDQGAQLVFGPTSVFQNPNQMVFDSNLRLLFVDDNVDGVWASTGPSSPPARLIEAADPEHIAVDRFNRIFTSSVDGTVRLYSPDGTLLDPAFATGLGPSPPIAIGPSDHAWGGHLYAIDQAGTLLRITMDKEIQTLGGGLADRNSILFGPDFALYVAEGSSNRILRIAPGATQLPSSSSACLWLLGAALLGASLSQLRQPSGPHMKARP